MIFEHIGRRNALHTIVLYFIIVGVGAFDDPEKAPRKWTVELGGANVVTPVPTDKQ